MSFSVFCFSDKGELFVPGYFKWQVFHPDGSLKFEQKPFRQVHVLDVIFRAGYYYLLIWPEMKHEAEIFKVSEESLKIEQQYSFSSIATDYIKWNYLAGSRDGLYILEPNGFWFYGISKGSGELKKWLPFFVNRFRQPDLVIREGERADLFCNIIAQVGEYLFIEYIVSEGRVPGKQRYKGTNFLMVNPKKREARVIYFRWQGWYPVNGWRGYLVGVCNVILAG